jgi:hypothetical protein
VIGVREVAGSNPVVPDQFLIINGCYVQGRSTALLEGIDKGGVTDWSGELPITGEYEIYVSNPPISDHVVKRALPYKLEVKIK